MISPLIATKKPAPVLGIKSLIVTLKPLGFPNNVGSSDKEYCVFATQIGKLPNPCDSYFFILFKTFLEKVTSSAPYISFAIVLILSAIGKSRL